MNFTEERKTEPEPVLIPAKSTTSQDFTDIKVESVEDAEDVLSHRPKYVE